MTIFGWDASDYDAGRGPMDLAAAARDGISWFTHKATEATNVRHENLGTMLNRARAAGIPVLGAYHVVRSSPSVAAQVSYFFAYLDEAVPWWRTWPGFLLQVDLEKWPYDPVSTPEAPERPGMPMFMDAKRALQAGGTGSSFAAELRRRAPASAFVVVYASKGQYGDTLAGLGSPLWNARYPSGSAGRYRSLYPGDDGSGWQTYSGQMPIFWQYTSSATIGSQTGCDANAYRGTLTQLQRLIGATTPEVDVAFTAAQEAQILTQLNDLHARSNWATGDHHSATDPGAPTASSPATTALTTLANISTAVSGLSTTGMTDEQIAALAGQVAAVVVTNHDALSEVDLAGVEASVQAALRAGTG